MTSPRLDFYERRAQERKPEDVAISRLRTALDWLVCDVQSEAMQSQPTSKWASVKTAYEVLDLTRMYDDGPVESEVRAAASTRRPEDVERERALKVLRGREGWARWMAIESRNNGRPEMADEWGRQGNALRTAIAALEREREMRSLLTELADDLETELNARYAGTLRYPSMQRRYDRDMEPVRRARAVLGGRDV